MPDKNTSAKTQNSTEDLASIEDLAEALIRKKNFQGTLEEVAQEKQWIIDTISDRIERGIALAFPDDKMDELSQFRDNPDETETEAAETDAKFAEFLKNAGVDYEKIAQDAIKDFCELYLKADKDGNVEDSEAEQTKQEEA